MIVFRQLNYTKTRRFHAISMPVIIEFSRCIGTYLSAKFELLKKLNDQEIIIGGICAGTDILAKAGILKDISSTHSSDLDCVCDKNIITARPNAYVDFAIEIGKALNIFEDEADLQETIEFWKNHKRIY